MGGPSTCSHSRRRRRRPVAESQRSQTARLHCAATGASWTTTSFRRSDKRRLVRSAELTCNDVVNEWTSSHASASTVRMYAVLRALMSYAEDSEIIARSPCRRVRLPRISPRVADILDADRLAMLANAMGSYGPMTYLGAFGLRWGEIAGLRVDRLDFLRQTVVIDHQVTRGLHGEMIESDPKTKAGHRPSLALPDWLMSMLAAGLGRAKRKHQYYPTRLCSSQQMAVGCTTPTGGAACGYPLVWPPASPSSTSTT